MSQALRDNEGNYWINGKKYKSVTTIIHEECPHSELELWKERTPDWPTKTRHARTYGMLMHLQLQNMIADIPVDIPPGMTPFFEWPEDIMDELEGRRNQWIAMNIVLGKPNLIEHTVVIEDHCEEGDVASAGTWDYWGPADGEIVILDWKSSKRPQRAHRIQMGAYYLGAKAEGLQVDRGLIPYIRRNSSQIVELEKDELEEEGKNFLHIARKSYLKVNGIKT